MNDIIVRVSQIELMVKHLRNTTRVARTEVHAADIFRMGGLMFDSKFNYKQSSTTKDRILQNPCNLDFHIWKLTILTKAG